MVAVNTDTDSIDLANVSVNLHFFSCGIEDWFHHNMEEAMSFYYGHGMDQIIYELYPYAEVLEQCWHKLSKKKDSDGVFCYEICENLGARLYIELLGDFDDSLIIQPDLKQWKSLSEKLIEKWCNRQIVYSDPLYFQLIESESVH